MSRLEQLKQALAQANEIVKHKEFTDDYGKPEQDFFKAYIVELAGEIINEEYDDDE